GKTAVITGGSRGIGAAIAKRLAAHGANVVITYHNSADKAEEVVSAIRLGGGKALAIQADSADPYAVAGAVDQAAQHFGSLDILVNNAGLGMHNHMSEFSIEDFDR